MKALSVLAATYPLILFSTLSLPVLAAPHNQGNGVVVLGGKIIDSACALAANSAYQVIEMEPVSVGEIIREGGGEIHPFSLRLVKCSLRRPAPSRPGSYLPDWEHVRVTFEGLTDREGRSFAAIGSSQGVALRITDVSGRESIPGVPMDLMQLTGDDQELHYALQLISNGRPLAVGSYRAAVRVRLEYF